MARVQKPAPAKKGGGSSPARQKPASAASRQLSPARRREDSIGPQTRRHAGQPSSPRVGGRLRNEIVIPIAVGAFALCASLGIVTSAAMKIGAPPALVGAA